MTEFTTFFEKVHEQFAKKSSLNGVMCLGSKPTLSQCWELEEPNGPKDQAYHHKGPVLVIP
jgi:hypothetical protein